MKIAFVIFDGMTTLDFIGVYDPLTRLKTMGIDPQVTWEICAPAPQVRDVSGLVLNATRANEPLSGYDLLVVPGGFSTRELAHNHAFIAWLKSAQEIPLKASVCTGALLLAAAGFLAGKRAATHPGARSDLQAAGVEVADERVVEDGGVITAGGVTAALDLGLYLVEKLAGSNARLKIQEQMDYSPATTADLQPPTLRTARIVRRTQETQVDMSLNLEGSGMHAIDTGIGFLDHMLTHIAVHGLFDLQVQARGDLHVDPHHTVEDVALTLGQAFSQALGSRAGIVRMASAYAPMDETLAMVAIDFSGRPFASLEVAWHSPAVGGLPTSLIEHFFESFAVAARCNLHARVLTGRDDHHQAEGLFKAFARAASAAVQIDPRRQGRIPSTKGTLTE